MPVYCYEAKDPKKGCPKCAEGFTVTQSISDAKLEKCPDCSCEIYRVISAPGLMHSKTDLHYRAKRAGFKCLKKVSMGEYETMY